MLYYQLKHKQTPFTIMFQIEWIPKAFRQLMKIKSLRNRRKIEEKVGMLDSWPGLSGTGHQEAGATIRIPFALR